MKWFTGTIPEAINKAKIEKTIFVVFVYDSSDTSKSIFDALESEEIDAIVSTEQYVSIKLENGKPDALQFSQIYPLVVVPSVFFINCENGQPLEIVAGEITNEQLLERMSKLPKKKKEDKPVPSQVNDSKPSTSVKEEAIAPDPVVTDPIPQTANSSAQDDACSDTEVASPPPKNDSPTPTLSLEEKVELAKQKLLEKQIEKEMEQKEIERQKEVERRKTGQEMIKAKQKRDEQEAISAAKSLRKEKEEDLLAREEVKRRIKADREEKEARAALFSANAAPPPVKKPVIAPTSSDSKQARIRFKFPDGSAITGDFDREVTLAEVRNYVRENGPLSRFNLNSTIHQRTFSAEDDSSTLAELGLVPSAIVVVTPTSRSTMSVAPSTEGGLMGLIWFILSPFNFIYSFARRLLGLEPNLNVNNQVPTPQPSQNEDTTDSNIPSSTRNRPKTAYGVRTRGGAGSSRTEGNIHRFHNVDDDDDDEDKKTWNGNSTQQM